MGNWSSASAVIRYIENSEISMRRNGRAIAMPGFTAPETMDLAPTVLPAASTTVQNAAVPKVMPSAPIVVPADQKEDNDCDCVCQCCEPEPDGDDVCPPPTKKKHGGIVFTGTIQQLIVLNSHDG